MKFFAILRDSVREALDAKVIYFVFGLTALFLVAMGSLSFQPEPADKGVRAILKRLPGAQAMGRRPPIEYDLENLEQTNEPAPAWKGEYRYDLVVKELTPDAGDHGEGDEGPQPKRPGQQQRGQFRAIVLMTGLMSKSEDEMTEEERASRKRLGKLLFAVMRSGGKPGPEMEKAAEALTREINAVTPAQMEAFLKTHLAGSGGLDMTSLKLTAEQDGTYRFRVDCKARPETVRTWPHALTVGYGALTIPAEIGVGVVVYTIEDFLVAGIGAGVAMMLSTIITAFFIPNMLRKGTVDLLVSKPIHRWALLLSKYIGGLTFMFFITLATVVGLWLVLGFRSGLWGTGFLLTIFVLTAQFAIFYAVSTLLAVLTRSPIVCILGTMLAWALLFGLDLTYKVMKPFHEFHLVPEWAYDSVDLTRRFLPRYKDLDAVNSDLIAGDLLSSDSPERKNIKKSVASIRWGESAGVTIGYIVLFLGLATWRFSVKDY